MSPFRLTLSHFSTLALVTTACGTETDAALSGPVQISVAVRPSAILDATLDPFGGRFWFVDGEDLYAVSDGVAEVVPLDLAVAPRGLAFGGGDVLYVADSDPSGGAIIAYDTGDGTATVLEATRGYAPRALDVVTRGGVEYVAFAGRKADEPGVFETAAADAEASAEVVTLASGAPLKEPDGLYAGETGLWVADRAAGAGGTGSVMVLESTGLRIVTEGFTAGAPCGISAPLDETAIFVSSVSAAGTAQVLIVNPATGATATYDEVIKDSPIAGGLHRARYTDHFAWAGLFGSIVTVVQTVGGLVSSSGKGTGKGSGTFNGGACTCNFSNRDACRSAGGTDAFCTNCC